MTILCSPQTPSFGPSNIKKISFTIMKNRDFKLLPLPWLHKLVPAGKSSVPIASAPATSLISASSQIGKWQGVAWTMLVLLSTWLLLMPPMVDVHNKQQCHDFFIFSQHCHSHFPCP